MDTQNRTLSSVLNKNQGAAAGSEMSTETKLTLVKRNFIEIYGINVFLRFPDPTVVSKEDYTGYLTSLSDLCIASAHVAEEAWQKSYPSYEQNFIRGRQTRAA